MLKLIEMRISSLPDHDKKCTLLFDEVSLYNKIIVTDLLIYIWKIWSRFCNLTCTVHKKCPLQPHINVYQISLKKHAAYNHNRDEMEGMDSNGKFITHALVLMARGLIADWKQV